MLTFMLVWTIATMTPHGLGNAKLVDPTRFQTEQECMAFAEKMSPRMPDWVRGLLRAPWTHEVAVVKIECEVDGAPA